MPYRKIGVKLTIAVGVTALGTISVFAYVNIRSHSASLLAEVERHAVQISETVRSSTDYDMLLNQPDRIHETIRRMGHQRSIERIRILNKAGQITYSSDAAEIGKMVDKTAESCYKCHSTQRPLERLDMNDRTRLMARGPERGRALGIITPIPNSPACWQAACHAHPRTQTVLGVLDVTLPLAAVDAEIRRGQVQIVVFAVSAVALLSLIVGVFLRRWVVQPVKALVAATERVAGGELAVTLDEGRADELGVLARAFNRMTRKLAEARMQLFQSDKLASLGRLAAGVAHEINNPLTGVLTYASFLAKRTEDRPEIREDLKVIVRETIRCREIVKSLLDFARQSVPKKSEADLNAIIDRALTIVGRQPSLHRVNVVRQLGADLPKVRVDANQMQQVFINLVVNAADALPAEGGTITLSTARLRLPPAGTTLIRHATCPRRHSLIDGEVRIEGKPAIRARVPEGRSAGLVYLDPVYGRATRRQGVVVDDPRGAAFVCPECAAPLAGERKQCPLCAAATYAFEVPPRGMVEGCTRQGCAWQRWPAVDSGGEIEFVEARVTDTGCGIPRENLSRIFEPFYSTKGPKGTGLGLAVIWGIVDNHDGSIGVASEEGKGTTFTIRIPVQA